LRAAPLIRLTGHLNASWIHPSHAEPLGAESVGAIPLSDAADAYPELTPPR
jgi:hypothetical protein